MHTFAVVLKTAGTQSIAVADNANGVIAGTQAGISVTAAAASTFGISAPATAVAGKSFTIAVTALDAYGNVAVGYSGKVHFTDSVSNGGLPSDYTFTAGDAGIHLFSVTLNTAVLQTINVTDVISSSIAGSATVSVSSSTSGGGSGSGGSGGSGSGGSGGSGGGSSGSGSGGNA